VTTRHVGLDLGGTNLKWVVLEHAAEWRTVASGQVATRVAEGPEAVVAQLAEVACDAAESVHGARSVGIGVPGLYDPDAGCIVFLPNVPGEWEGRPVAGPVARATGLATALINDARAFGLAELRLGAGRGAGTMIGLTLGTGVGGMVAVDGQVRQADSGRAGELGHQTIDPDGPWCGCGNRGCLEAFARADQVARLCRTPTAEAAVRAAAAGDPDAVWGLAQVGRYLGIGIANAIVALAPERVVLGGGVAGAGELLLRPIREEVARRVFVTSLERVRIVTAELGTWAGAMGAAIHGAERAMAAR
jgi:glucokinase